MLENEFVTENKKSISDENESSNNSNIIAIKHNISWGFDLILRLILVYPILSFIAISIVFFANIILEFIILILKIINDNSTIKTNVYIAAILFSGLSYLFYLCKLCFKIFVSFEKCAFIVWNNKYDYHPYIFTLCGIKFIKYGNIVRLLILVFMITVSIRMTYLGITDGVLIQQSPSPQDLRLWELWMIVCIYIGSIMSVSYLIIQSIWNLYNSFTHIYSVIDVVKFIFLVLFLENNNDNKAIIIQYLKEILLHIIHVLLLILVYSYELIMKCDHIELHILGFMFGVLLYVILLIRQIPSKKKLFYYLVDRRSHGSRILKLLLIYWIIFGCIFGLGMYGSKYLNNIITTKGDPYSDPYFDINSTLYNHDTFPTQKYPICSYFGESNYVLNQAFLSMIVYDDNEKNIEKGVNIFLGPNWNIIYYDLYSSPSFIHLMNNETNEHNIVIRGTTNIKEYYEDFTLYSEILVLFIFNRVIPIFGSMPNEIIQTIIKQASIFEQYVLYSDLENRFHNGMMQYIETFIKKQNNSLLISGHSLGGIIATIVAAKLRDKHWPVKSMAINSPGIYFLIKKFGIKIQHLRKISTSILSAYDVLSQSIGENTGLVAYIGWYLHYIYIIYIRSIICIF